MTAPFTRRDFIKASAAAALAAKLPLSMSAAAAASPKLSTKLPRWRGFNLLEKFISSVSNAPFRESDFAWIAEWGFDFVRLPMSYRCWSSPEKWRHSDEKVLAEIDQAVEYGRKYGIHVCLNFHRAPGYSVDGSTAEPFNLWKDAEALEACAYHWGNFSRRYKGISSSRLSFDLVNEPATLTTEPYVFLDDETYARVARVLVKAIRNEDADRLIISDGLMWGTVPVPALADLGIAQSTRGYTPHLVSHWKAEWIEGSDKWTEPTWPLVPSESEVDYMSKTRDSLKPIFRANPLWQKAAAAVDFKATWDRKRLADGLTMWKELEAMGVGVHVGECGVYNKTPHRVALGFLEDNLACWKEAGWGWALWNFRGEFGILDSERADVAYEDFRGHKLDRAMLDLLRRY